MIGGLFNRLTRRRSTDMAAIDKLQILKEESPLSASWCQTESFVTSESGAETYLLAFSDHEAEENAQWQVFLVQHTAHSQEKDLVETSTYQENLSFEDVLVSFRKYEVLAQQGEKSVGRFSRQGLGIRHYEAFCVHHGLHVPSEGGRSLPQRSIEGQLVRRDQGQSSSLDMVQTRDLSPILKAEAALIPDWRAVIESEKQPFDPQRVRLPARLIPFARIAQSEPSKDLDSVSYYYRYLGQAIRGAEMADGRFAVMNKGDEYELLLSVFEEKGRLTASDIPAVQEALEKFDRFLVSEGKFSKSDIQKNQQGVRRALCRLYMFAPDQMVLSVDLVKKFLTLPFGKPDEMILSCLERGASPKILEDAVQTSLVHYAVAHENRALLQAALQQGTTFKATQEKELLEKVALSQPEMVTDFMSAGVNFHKIASSTTPQKSLFCTALVAGKEKSVQEMLKGMPAEALHQKNGFDVSPLEQAVLVGHKSIILQMHFSLIGQLSAHEKKRLAERCLEAKQDVSLALLIDLDTDYFFSLSEPQRAEVSMKPMLQETLQKLAEEPLRLTEQENLSLHTFLKEAVLVAPKTAEKKYPNPPRPPVPPKSRRL